MRSRLMRRYVKKPRNDSQAQHDATGLDATHARSPSMPSPLPWAPTFSFGRVVPRPALGIWSGEGMHRGVAQAALLHRAHCNRAAHRGEYGVAMELP